MESADLIPSWMTLRENIDENFNVIKSEGIRDLHELHGVLKTKVKLQQFSKQSGLPEEYLAVLRRAVNGYLPKPDKIKYFGVPKSIVAKLEKLGIKNTLQLYDKILTPKRRAMLSAQAGIDKKEILRLTKLTDLSRIKWVNHTFACVLYEAGYDTAAKVARANHKKLHEKISRLNEEKKWYNAHIGLRDMKRCVEAAKAVPFEIMY